MPTHIWQIQMPGVTVTSPKPDSLGWYLTTDDHVSIVGETGPRTDQAVDPWPSDRRATLAEVRF